MKCIKRRNISCKLYTLYPCLCKSSSSLILIKTITEWKENGLIELPNNDFLLKRSEGDKPHGQQLKREVWPDLTNTVVFGKRLL